MNIVTSIHTVCMLSIHQVHSIHLHQVTNTSLRRLPCVHPRVRIHDCGRTSVSGAACGPARQPRPRALAVAPDHLKATVREGEWVLVEVAVRGPPGGSGVVHAVPRRAVHVTEPR